MGDSSTCAFGNCFNFDRRLQLPRNFLYVGATQSGKTSLFFRSLENAEENYYPVPSVIYFLYNCFQSNYLEIKGKLSRQGIRIEFSQASDFGEEDLKKISESSEGQIIVALDDATVTSTKSQKIAHMFTVCRHMRISLILFWHTLFANTPHARLISQNTSYTFLLSSPRMANSVGTLGGHMNMRKL